MLRRASLGLAGIALPVLEMQQLVLEQQWYMSDCLKEEMIEYPDYLPALEACLSVLQDFYQNETRPEADLIESKVRPHLRMAYKEKVIDFSVDFVRGFLSEEIDKSD